MPSRHTSRTIIQVKVEQGAAGSTDLVAAPAGLLIHVVSFYLVLDAAGTVKFTEGTGPTDLTGLMPVGSNGVLQAHSGENDVPVLSTQTSGSKLSVVSGTGKLHGWVRYFTSVEP